VRKLRSKDWVVYAKPPFGGPQQVLKYLARYTHRVAISNQRVLSLEDGKVTFRYKDYAHGDRQRTMRLDAVEFIRRFLLHVLPKGFVRIRYYGFLANSQRKNKLALIRQLLGTPVPPPADTSHQGTSTIGEDELELCPECKQGRMRRVDTIPPTTQTAPAPWWTDTS
jgi:hypothetical protein